MFPLFDELLRASMRVQMALLSVAGKVADTPTVSATTNAMHDATTKCVEFWLDAEERINRHGGPRADK
jgi:hypothetical protein